MGGQAPLSLQGPDFVLAEPYALTISGEIMYELESEELGGDTGIERVLLDPIGTVSGVKLLAKLARAEGHDISRGFVVSSKDARAVLLGLEVAGMLDKPYVNVVILTSIQLEPDHEDLEVRLHTTATVVRALATDLDLVVVPFPPQMPYLPRWTPERTADSRLAMSFRRLSTDWLLVLGVEGLSFAR